MKIILVSKCYLDVEQYVEFKMSVLISPSKGPHKLALGHYIYIFGMEMTPRIRGEKGIHFWKGNESENPFLVSNKYH